MSDNELEEFCCESNFNESHSSKDNDINHNINSTVNDNLECKLYRIAHKLQKHCQRECLPLFNRNNTMGHLSETVRQ